MAPNIVVFFTDQQRWDTAGVHGNPMGLTPNFDREAARGTHLANSFTCQPVCGPARSCLQTGRYATETGVFRNGIMPDPQLPMLGTLFGEAGYDTGYIGKWHLGSDRLAVSPEERRGYDYWLGANLLEFSSDAYDTRMYDGDGNEVFLPGYRVDAVTDAAIRYIGGEHRSGDKPFFLFTSFLEPHFQNHRDDYPAPPGYEERYRGGWVPPDLAALGGSTHQHLGGYYGMVKRLDEAFGRVLDALESLSLAEETVVLFTSDHGCHFKTRNGEYKRSCHESSIRVPSLLRGGPFNGGGRVDELVSLVNLPKTLLDAGGVDPAPGMRGSSLLPLVNRTDRSWPDDVFVQISESQVGRAVRTHRWKYAVEAPEADPWNVSASDSYQEASLYDLLADPYELNNLVGVESHRAVADRMKERLLGHIGDIESATPNIVNAAPRPPDAKLHVSDYEVDL